MLCVTFLVDIEFGCTLTCKPYYIVHYPTLDYLTASINHYVYVYLTELLITLYKSLRVT